MRRAAKKDGPHAEIAMAFRRYGWFVLETYQLGDDAPDFVAVKRVTVH